MIGKPTPQRLTPEQQKLSDEATIFVLAGCMMTVYQLMQAKQGRALTDVIMKVGTVLSREPEFIKRFELAQKLVMDEYNKMTAAPKIQVVPAGTVP